MSFLNAGKQAFKRWLTPLTCPADDFAFLVRICCHERVAELTTDHLPQLYLEDAKTSFKKLFSIRHIVFSGANDGCSQIMTSRIFLISVELHMRSINQASKQGYRSDIQSIVTFEKSCFSLSFKLHANWMTCKWCLNKEGRKRWKSIYVLTNWVIIVPLPSEDKCQMLVGVCGDFAKCERRLCCNHVAKSLLDISAPFYDDFDHR